MQLLNRKEGPVVRISSTQEEKAAINRVLTDFGWRMTSARWFRTMICVKFHRIVKIFVGNCVNDFRFMK